MKPRPTVALPLPRSPHALGRRLTRAVVVSSAVALLLSGLIFDAFVYLSLRAALIEELTVQARITAEHSSAALVFDDRRVATATLASLEASPLIRHAELRGADGQPIAHFRAAGRATEPLPAVDPAGSAEVVHAFTDDALVVVAPVVEHGRVLGSLHVVASLAPLRLRVALYVAITALAGALAFAVAYLLVIRVRREVDATEHRLDYLAFFDPVTGLRNRHAAVEALRALIERAEGRAQAGFALLLVDLDDFKVVNDTLGHAAGDAVLQAVAARLSKYVQSEELVFRFGGDEFLVIAPGEQDAAQLRLLGQSVGVALEEPAEVAGRLIHVRSSVGIARYPLDATEQAALLRAADTAMYAAKALGKNTFEVFRAEMETHAQSRIRLDNDLRRAIERDELHLVYQPIVQLPSQRLVGVEALLRWNHPELGAVSPAEFVPVAERSGQIIDIGQWVLHAGCRQLKAWADAGHDDVYLAVNVSARQLRRGLTAQVEAALAASGADPAALEIEITEHSMVEDIDSNVAQLSALRERGLKVAVDDFGTGLSSLAYLKRLPINKLKIDRAFVKDLPQGGDDAAIVAAIASMARSLHLTLVAEGVETEAQHRFLAAQGCELIQGYLYSRPLPAAAVTELLHRQQRGEALWPAVRVESPGKPTIRLASTAAAEAG